MSIVKVCGTRLKPHEKHQQEKYECGIIVCSVVSKICLILINQSEFYVSSNETSPGS